MIKLLAIWLVFLLGPKVFAFGLLDNGCKFLAIPEEECQPILNDNLSDNEKKELIANLGINQSEKLDHDALLNYANKIEFEAETPPEGADVKERLGKIIEKIWVKIIGVYPSVYDLDEKEWFVHNKGNVKVAKKYVLNEPKPKKRIGNCIFVGNKEGPKITETLENYINNNFIGSGDNQNFEFEKLPENLNFKSRYTVEYKVTFEYRPICNGKNKTCGKCHDIIHEDSATVEHSFNAKFRKFNYEYDYSNQEINGFNTILLGIKANQPFKKVIAGKGKALAKFGNSANDLFWNSEPYDVLHFSRNNREHRNFENSAKLPYENFLDYDLNALYLIGSTDKSNDCKYKIIHDFGEINPDSNCSSWQLPETKLYLTSDKNKYSNAEPIKIHLAAKDNSGNVIANRIVKVIIPNETIVLKTDNRGKAELELPQTREDFSIEAEAEQTFEFGKGKTGIKIDIDNLQKFESAKVLAGIGLAYFLLFAILKRTLGVKT